LLCSSKPVSLSLPAFSLPYREPTGVSGKDVWLARVAHAPDGPWPRYPALMLRRIHKSGWVYLAWLLRLKQAATVAKIRGEGSRPPVSLESELVKVTSRPAASHHITPPLRWGFAAFLSTVAPDGKIAK
jgi:hypothetical protein